MSNDKMNEFFKELELQNNIENYLHNNITPTFPKSTINYNIGLSKKLYPLMEEYINNQIPIIEKININDETNSIKQSIESCNKFIKILTNNPPEVETCPVCMTEFEETNYVIPKCNHKVCAICFTNNIKYNKQTGDCCVLCRKRIC